MAALASPFSFFPSHLNTLKAPKRVYSSERVLLGYSGFFNDSANFTWAIFQLCTLTAMAAVSNTTRFDTA